MKTKYSEMALACLVTTLLLTACGGGGGGSGATATPTVQQYAYGIWDGAFSSTPVKMVVLPNGGFFQWFGTSVPLGQLHGSLVVNASNQLGFSSSYGMLNGLYEQNWSITTSSIVTASTLSFTASGARQGSCRLGHAANG